MPGKLIPAASVRNICGGVSDMTLWRWTHTPELNFPKPIYIGKRRYWRADELEAWIDARAAASA